MSVLAADAVTPGLTITHREQLDDKGKPYMQALRKPIAVKRTTECRGQWRTHVHINGGCWDGRTRLAVEPTENTEN